MFLRPSRGFFPAAQINRAGDGNAVFVAQNPANPYRRGHLIFGIANALADQVLGLADAAVAIDIDAGVPEKAGWKNRNGDEGLWLAKQRKPVRGERHLGDIEFAVPQHAEESFFDGKVEVVQIDAVDGDAILQQSARAVVVPASHRQPKLGHLPSPLRARRVRNLFASARCRRTPGRAACRRSAPSVAILQVNFSGQ